MSSKWARARDRFWGKPVPDHLPHGPNTWAYKAYGCDCRACLPSGRRHNGQRKSTAQRQKEFRERKRGKPVPPGTRHGIYTYRAYGCRCDFCVAANRRARNRQRNAWAETAQGSWIPGDNGATTVHWPARGYGMWACPECGEKFEMRRPVDGHAAAA